MNHYAPRSRQTANLLAYRPEMVRKQRVGRAACAEAALVAPLPEPVPVSAHSGDGQPRVALRPGAVFEAATAIITATHGPRPAIKRVAWSARQHGSAEATRIATGMTAELDSMTEAFNWDRRVTKFTRAIVEETRCLV